MCAGRLVVSGGRETPSCTPRCLNDVSPRAGGGSQSPLAFVIWFPRGLSEQVLTRIPGPQLSHARGGGGGMFALRVNQPTNFRVQELELHFG